MDLCIPFFKDKFHSSFGVSYKGNFVKGWFWRMYLYPPSSRQRYILSGPVVRDTARLSQRYPPIARYRVFGVSPWPIGCDTPSPFFERFPCKVEVRYPPPPQNGYLRDTCAIPYENKANGCDTQLCDTISKGYCAIWGGISHWAAKGTSAMFCPS